MEEVVNNYFFLAIADLRPLSFVELASLCGKHHDGEHERLVALPLTSEVLFECLMSSGVPGSAWEMMRKQNFISPGHDLSYDKSPCGNARM